MHCDSYTEIKITLDRGFITIIERGGSPDRTIRLLAIEGNMLDFVEKGLGHNRQSSVTTQIHVRSVSENTAIVGIRSDDEMVNPSVNTFGELLLMHQLW